MSGVAGTFAHSGFERAEHERRVRWRLDRLGQPGGVSARGVPARLDDDTEAYATDRFGDTRRRTGRTSRDLITLLC